MSGKPSATNRSCTRRLALLACGLLLIALGLFSVRLARWLRKTEPDPSLASSSIPSDPRLAYSGPYRNIHPSVRYVGDAACRSCHVHDDILASFARHPMGRSLLRAEDLLDHQRYGPDTNNPFTAVGRRFQVDRQGNRLWHRQAVLDESGRPAAELAQEIHWAIGSGQKGYSYLTEQDGYLFQTAISWFTHKQRWDLSPGFASTSLPGRLVPASCLFCHANSVREHPRQPSRFLPPIFEGHGIGCERCHGPGELHVQGDLDHTIVNPDRLSPALRDAVCEQCHLEGEERILRSGRGLFDYRPGLPLHDFWAVLVRQRPSGEDAKAVNHVEQMYQSKCFQRPVGALKLGCTTCHDPHVYIGPAERAVYYRVKCLQCHDEKTKGQQGCSASMSRRRQTSPADNCIDCHMPRYAASDIAHTASTDHRIVRRPNRQPIRATDLENAPLVDFYRDRFPQGDPQTERTLGLGMVRRISANLLPRQGNADRALRLLESALANDPSDGAVREGKVEAYLLLHRPAEALDEAGLLLPEQAENWQLLAQAAYVAQADGQMERARAYWRRAVEINPFVSNYQAALVDVLLRAEQWDEARRHCEQLLRLDPFNVSGRQAWVGFLLQQGQRAEARRQFDIVRQLKPPDLAAREEWFQQQMR